MKSWHLWQWNWVYAKQNKSGGGRKIPDDFMHMGIKRNKTNEQKN